MHRENDVVARLYQLLKTEFDQLSRRDIERIEETLEAKQALLSELEALSEMRYRILAENGFSADKDGHDAFINSVEGSGGDALRASWQALQQTLEDCQQQNQVNGQVLEASRRGAEQALAVLLGKDGTQPTLYNEKGSTEPSLSGRSHIKV